MSFVNAVQDIDNKLPSQNKHGILFLKIDMKAIIFITKYFQIRN